MPDEKVGQNDTGFDFPGERQKADRRGAILVSLPKWAAYAVIAWQMRLSIEVLVGKNAMPSFLARFWRQASLWEVVCWISGTLGLLLGLYARHLLHRQAAQDLSRMQSVESRLDALEKASHRSNA